MNRKNKEVPDKEEKDLDEVQAEEEVEEPKSTDEGGGDEVQPEPTPGEEEKKAEDELHNKLLRLQADFLNYKSRTEKERITTYGNAVSDVIKDLLPVIDNLERAIEAEKSELGSFKEGVVMIYNQLHDILAKRGMKEIEAIDKPFDHNIHYGVAFDAESEKEDGTVIEVFQKGYTVNDRVIRPSMVKIVKK